jgi:hypothetical protein
LIKGENFSGLVLHFDEVNYLSAAGRKYLIENIGSALLPASGPSVLFLPLITGTTNTAIKIVKLSKFANERLVLSPLSSEAILEMTIDQTNLASLPAQA